MVLRPKGLGLGADRSVLANAAKVIAETKDAEEKLNLLKGSYVQVVGGKQQGFYGQVSHWCCIRCYNLFDHYVFELMLRSKVWMRIPLERAFGWQLAVRWSASASCV